MEVNTICCEKEMIELSIGYMGNQNTTSLKRFICGECGCFLDIHGYSLDDDEYEQTCEDYEEELKNTTFFKEIKAKICEVEKNAN